MSEPRDRQTEFDFDRQASEYAELIRDPARDRFAASSQFFAERKLQVIRSFYDRLEIDTQHLDWLDVGCGQGELLRIGQPYFKTVSGCDPAEGMLGFCPDLNVRRQPAIDSLPFQNSSFDLITLVCVYHHIELNRRQALTNEAVRLLRPNGIVCVIEHNPWNPITKRIVSRTPVDADAKLLSIRLTRHLLSSAGIVDLRRRFFLFLPERFHKHFAAVEDRLGALPIGGQYAVFGQKKL